MGLQQLGLLVGTLFEGLLAIGLDAVEFFIDLLLGWRRFHPANTQARAGFVDEVNGFVWQEAVRDVAVGQVGGSHQRLIGNGHRVELFVDVAKTLQDFNGVSHGGLIHLDGLEAALESGILLNVLAVFLSGGGTNGLEFTASQHRLQDGGGVNGTFGSTGSHERVDFVDEQNDVATSTDFLEHLL